MKGFLFVTVLSGASNLIYLTGADVMHEANHAYSFPEHLESLPL